LTNSERDFLRVGEVIKPHGIEGELVVDCLTDHPEIRFEPGNEITVFNEDHEPESLTVEDFRWHQGRILLSVEEISDRNDAELYRERLLGVSTEDRIDNDEGFYADDLIGLDVFSENGESRGTVAAVHPDEMNPLIKINTGEDSYDFPLSYDLIVDVDEEDNRLVLRFPEGWKKLINP
jgi:16S rRNA processing protein RimM